MPEDCIQTDTRLVRHSEAAACDRLPANCPFTKRLPKGRDRIRQAIEDGAIPCCRMMRPFWIIRADEPPLCRIEGDEVYRFFYTQAFGEHAMILLGKRRDEITVQRRYYPGLFCNKAERFEALLTEAEWRVLQDAMAAADFWSLPREVRPEGFWLDGYDLIVEGRRGTEFRAVRFDNPDVERFWLLGRIAFDLAGLPEMRL